MFHLFLIAYIFVTEAVDQISTSFNFFQDFNIFYSLFFHILFPLLYTYMYSLHVTRFTTCQKFFFKYVNKTFIFIFILSFVIKPEKIIHSIMTVDSENPHIPKQKNRGGRQLSTIWEDINQGQAVAPGKFSASCKYCEKTWTRGEISKLEEHLSNHCQSAPANVVRKYMTKILERQDKSTKKRKLSSGGQQNIYDYHDSIDLPESRITRINRALIKFFVACGISFRIVEHPFFINLLKELNGGYDPPSREILAGQMLERELAQVNSNVKSEIEKSTNLTIGLF